jgi:site-specific DNA recombinase
MHKHITHNRCHETFADFSDAIRTFLREGVREDIHTLDGQIARLRRGIARLIDSYAEGIIGRADFEQRINGLKQRVGRLENDRKVLTEKVELERDLVLVIGRLQEFTSRLQTGLGELGWTGRREVIRALVKRIEIDHEKIELVFRVPGPSADGGTPSESPLTDMAPPNRQHCGNVHRRLARQPSLPEHAPKAALPRATSAPDSRYRQGRWAG